jgi:hypothetical protein
VKSTDTDDDESINTYDSTESANEVAPVTVTRLKEPTMSNAEITRRNLADYSKESTGDNAPITVTASAESAQVKLEVNQGRVIYSHADNG